MMDAFNTIADLIGNVAAVVAAVGVLFVNAKLDRLISATPTSSMSSTSGQCAGRQRLALSVYARAGLRCLEARLGLVPRYDFKATGRQSGTAFTTA